MGLKTSATKSRLCSGTPSPYTLTPKFSRLKPTSTTWRLTPVAVLFGTFYPNKRLFSRFRSSRNVVVAVAPPAISTINFLPHLPAPKIRALRSVVCGTLWKFVVSYQYPFWWKEGFSGDIYILDGEGPPKCPIICSFNNIVQNNAALSGYFTPNRIQEQMGFLQELAQYLGAPTLQPLQLAARKWTASPMCCFNSHEDVEHISSSMKR